MATTCDKCGKNNFLSIYSHTSDDNFYKWNDKEEKQGRLPTFSGISKAGECTFSICVECGWIVGLNLKQLKSELNKEWADTKVPKKNVNNALILDFDDDYDYVALEKIRSKKLSDDDKDLPKVMMMRHRGPVKKTSSNKIVKDDSDSDDDKDLPKMMMMRHRGAVKKTSSKKIAKDDSDSDSDDNYVPQIKMLQYRGPAKKTSAKK